MWSDPEEVDTWAMSPRGAGWLFGAKVTNEVNYNYNVIYDSEIEEWQKDIVNKVGNQC